MSDNELDFWALSVERVCRAAKRDPRSHEAKVFVIFVHKDATMPEYAPESEAPKGAYLVERWELVGEKGTWVLKI